MALKPEEKEKWLLAGEISAKARDFIASKVRKGVKILELCEAGEAYIKKLGGKPAFPVNISVNNVAAHYTSPPFDPSIIDDNSFVKIDVGAHVDGYIGDTAVTVYVGKHVKEAKRIMDANKEALEKAIEVIKDGVRVRDVSEVIWKTAHEHGYSVLTDLNGHEIKRYNLHAGLTIPNTPRSLDFLGLNKGPKLREGMVIAIEPFFIPAKTDSETEPDYTKTYIFSLRKMKKPSGLIYKKLYATFNGLPFALRWLIKKKNQINSALKILNELDKKKLLNAYPTLIEEKNRNVTQFEHTVLVGKSSATILTLPNH